MFYYKVKIKTRVMCMLTVSCFLFSCVNDSYYEELSELDSQLLSLIDQKSNGIGPYFFQLPNANDYARIPQDPLNPITPQKVALGKMLVHETATGGNAKMESTVETFSCASCHPVAASFYSGNLQGIGEGGKGFGLIGEGRIIDQNLPIDSVDIEPIKVPSLLNSAYQEVMLWSGALGGTGINTPYVAQNANSIPENLLGYQGLETQGMAGQTAHRLRIDEDFVANYGYRELFDAAFPDLPENERYTQITAGLAIAAYNRTLLANESPWQDWLKGAYNQMSNPEKRGAILFFDKARCINCHTGPALKSNAFYALGMKDIDQTNGIIIDPEDSTVRNKGRGGFTNNSADDYKFKVPNLYNLKSNNFFGHGGSFTSLQEVITYIVSGEKQNNKVPNTQLAADFVDLNLSQQEINDVVTFIENALYDSNLERYVPTQVFSGNCIPNSDLQSQIDLGCN